MLDQLPTHGVVEAGFQFYHEYTREPGHINFVFTLRFVFLRRENELRREGNNAQIYKPKNRSNTGRLRGPLGLILQP